MDLLVEKEMASLRSLCKKHCVENLFLFGSAVKGKFYENSDLDFLVNFSSDLKLSDYADNYFDFLEKLQQLFGREIDLISEKSLKNPVLIQEINKTKVSVYEA
jgi:predicted nucleotidyltransferase